LRAHRLRARTSILEFVTMNRPRTMHTLQALQGAGVAPRQYCSIAVDGSLVG